MPVRRPVWSGICHCLGEQETWAGPFPLLGLRGPNCKVRGDGEKLPLFPWLHEVAQGDCGQFPWLALSCFGGFVASLEGPDIGMAHPQLGSVRADMYCINQDMI